jgi:hypothetical protein
VAQAGGDAHWVPGGIGMRVTTATAPGHPGRANEDFAGAVAHAAVLVDGAGIRDAGYLCRHGVAWYAHRLGGNLLARLSLDGGGAGPLTDVATIVAAAIDEVTSLHRDTCDVQDPSSPSATVAVVRVAGDRVDHLLLGDSVIVIDRTDGVAQVVEDRREIELGTPWRDALAALEPGSAEYDQVRGEAVTLFRASRNQPGGFWVAKDDGRVVSEAIVGSHPIDEVAGVVLLSNGASRVVDRFGLLGWHEISSYEPDELLRLVRDAERAASVDSDDATVACCADLG